MSEKFSTGTKNPNETNIYLGAIFTCPVNFSKNAEILAQAGGRALEKIISALHSNKVLDSTSMNNCITTASFLS